MKKYILGIDQSTSGTKTVLFDAKGEIAGRCDLPHAQKINEKGWVSHDPEEIYSNVLLGVKKLLDATGADSAEIAAVGICNQRETALVWDRKTGKPLQDAIVWQCGRAAEICTKLADRAEAVLEKTGIPFSPYYSAAKIAWILNHTAAQGRSLCAGTMDSWLVYKLTGGAVFQTDYSNASRTQLLHVTERKWDEEICCWLDISPELLPRLCDSNGNFGETDFEGLLAVPVPICGVMGDSHGALYAQGCHMPGMVKATYGTGSSVMMNVGEKPVWSKNGLATSLAWSLDGKAEYVLEGNINYTGSVIQWMTNDLQLLPSAKEAGAMARQANPADTTYLVPAFTGLGAPYWNSAVKAMFWGMGRGTGRAELIKAGEESIAYQIADIVNLMKQETAAEIASLRVDGGPTRDSYLMQFQSDILGTALSVPEKEELSVMGAVYAAGIKIGFYPPDIVHRQQRTSYTPRMEQEERSRKYSGWKTAVQTLTGK